MTSIRELDTVIRSRHLLKHPFYRAWSEGKVSMDTLRTYAGQYFQFESNFPRYVGGVYARLPSPGSRRVLLQNMVDEEGRSPTHPELWLRFARGLGMGSEVVRRAPVGPATDRLLQEYERSTIRSSPARGLGALYAYESIFPEIAAEKSRGLREHYGLTDLAAHEFFRVHTMADVEHARAERTILRKELAASEKAGEEARRGVDGAVTAWWRFLSAFPT
ncbi:MAG: CADD family putative folate metabolism protein [Thermoplasmata archaeon]|nr:CADD family putative folate metabolism protein [Thermoplasmata archaeon]